MPSEKKKNHPHRPSSDYVPTHTTAVYQVRMDNVVDHCDIMKLDLQGYELPALRGGEKLLSDCQVIITEISFVPHYKNQTLFLELYQWLSERDFKLYDLYIDNTETGQINHGDAVFLKQSVYNYNQSLIDWFSHEY
jgi:hypothetical protein